MQLAKSERTVLLLLSKATPQFGDCLDKNMKKVTFVFYSKYYVGIEAEPPEVLQ